MLIRIVRMTFQEEKIKDFLDNFHKTKKQIRSFEGCEHLELWQDKDQENIFVTYSHWQSQENLDSYRKSELFKEIWSFTKKLFVGKPQAFSVNQEEVVKI